MNTVHKLTTHARPMHQTRTKLLLGGLCSLACLTPYAHGAITDAHIFKKDAHTVIALYVQQHAVIGTLTPEKEAQCQDWLAAAGVIRTALHAHAQANQNIHALIQSSELSPELSLAYHPASNVEYTVIREFEAALGQERVTHLEIIEPVRALTQALDMVEEHIRAFVIQQNPESSKPGETAYDIVKDFEKIKSAKRAQFFKSPEWLQCEQALRAIPLSCRDYCTHMHALSSVHTSIVPEAYTAPAGAGSSVDPASGVVAAQPTPAADWIEKRRGGEQAAIAQYVSAIQKKFIKDANPDMPIAALVIDILKRQKSYTDVHELLCIPHTQALSAYNMITLAYTLARQASEHSCLFVMVPQDTRSTIAHTLKSVGFTVSAILGAHTDVTAPALGSFLNQNLTQPGQPASIAAPTPTANNRQLTITPEQRSALENLVAKSDITRESLQTQPGAKTELHTAASAPDTERMEQVLAALTVFNIPVCDYLERRNATGSTALIHAARNNNLAGARLLLEAFDHAGGNIPAYLHRDELTHKNPTGRPIGTALHVAAWQGYTDLMELLFDYGVHANIRNAENSTALHFAGTPDVIRLLVHHGALVNALDKTGETPLHTAARANKKAIVKALLDAGADRTLTNSEGQTAAQVTESPEIKLLLAIQHRRENQQKLKK